MLLPLLLESPFSQITYVVGYTFFKMALVGSLKTRARGRDPCEDRSEKVLSLFEPHTRAIPRHKGGALVEFGRLVTLDE